MPMLFTPLIASRANGEARVSVKFSRRCSAAVTDRRSATRTAEGNRGARDRRQQPSATSIKLRSIVCALSCRTTKQTPSTA
jgi:hypothetical protein